MSNKITLNGGSRMAEGIYVRAADKPIIAFNEINAVSPGSAYGIATDDIASSSIYRNDKKNIHIFVFF